MKSETRRQKLRYSIGGKFEGSELSRFQGRKKTKVFRGRVKDISEGGFCPLAALASPFFFRDCSGLLRCL